MWSLALQGELQGIWFWSATYAVLVCGYSVAYQFSIRSWPSTLGSLNEAIVARFGYSQRVTSDQEYRAETFYSYSVSNQKYRGRRVSPWIIVASHNLRFVLKKQLSGVKSDSNGMVDVFYKPNRPEKSFLVKPGIAGMGVTFVLGSVLAIAYLFRFHF